MKLLEQVSLFFQEGKSDKVYEVDLLEVSPGSCVVNFRYGRRGSTLREGSKTVVAIPYAEARKVFDRLVQEKVDGGYLRSGQAPTPVSATPSAPSAGPTPASASTAQSARTQGLLDALSSMSKLASGAASTVRAWLSSTPAPTVHPRSLERLIWSAGDARHRGVESHLLAHLPGASPLRTYCLAYALGRCGGEASIAPLRTLFNDRAQPDHVRRMVTEALLALSTGPARAELQAAFLEKLPPPLREQVRAGSAIAIRQELGKLIDPAKTETLSVLHTLYLLDGEAVREVLLETMRELPLRPTTIRAFRDLFKSAEFRADGRMFGLIAYRFEKAPSTGSSRQRGYSKRTRLYLRRRVWRTVRRQGQLGSPDFVKLAVGVLVAFRDEDAGQSYLTRPYRQAPLTWPPFASYWAFNHLLYGKSSRMIPAQHRLAFHLRAGLTVLAPVAEREEAFPQLWEQTPPALLVLCEESRSALVHEFAAKALRACPAFLAELDIEALAMLLARPYEPTAKLGFDQAVLRMDAKHEPRPLLLALARSAHLPARSQAHAWIDEVRAALLTDMPFWAGLLSAPFSDTRTFARRSIRGVPLSNEQQAALLAGLVSAAIAAKPGDEEMVSDVTQAVLETLTQLGSASLESIRALLLHPLAPVRELGGELLLKKNYRVEPVPEDLLLTLLDSEHAGLRALGLRLLATLPEPVLVAHELLLARLATSKLADVRHALRTILQRLAKADCAAGARVALLLLEALLRRMLPEGVPAFVGQVLREDFADALVQLNVDTVWRLLDSADSDAQSLGAELLARRGLASFQLPMPSLVRFASHELVSVRELAWRELEARIADLHADLPSAVRMLDSRWDDTRAFGFRLLREKVPEAGFSIDTLVAICDSVRPDVQAFGRELITRHFKDTDGAALLLKLSEHPAPDVQLFATQYLERYATNRRELWEKLIPFFTRLLFAVNKSRVAKARVLRFLEEEGRRDAASAGRVVELLHTLTATVAKEDHAAAVETMLKVHRAQPSVALPLKLISPEVRHGV